MKKSIINEDFEAAIQDMEQSSKPKHRFNVGDSVKVKDNLIVGQWYDGLLFNESMEQYKGKETTVRYIIYEEYVLDLGPYFYNDLMLEKLE